MDHSFFFYVIFWFGGPIVFIGDRVFNMLEWVFDKINF